MIILSDLDDVVTQWSEGFDDLLESEGAPPEIRRKPDRVQFNMHHGLIEEHSSIISRLMNIDGFYRSLKPVDGAVEGLNRLGEKHHVMLVSSPWAGNENCASEKVAWVREHLGIEWENRLILTHDKTLVHGDVLIDDKDLITGAVAPHWARIIYSQPWNGSIIGGFRVNSWADMDEMVNYVLRFRGGQ